MKSDQGEKDLGAGPTGSSPTSTRRFSNLWTAVAGGAGKKLRQSKNSSQHVDEEAETTATFCGESVLAAAAVALSAKHGTRLEVVLAADEGREEALPCRGATTPEEFGR